MRLVERENEIINIIKKIVRKKLNFVLVGGYAVSGLARHRFSVDCDIVIPKTQMKKFAEFLKGDGYGKHAKKEDFDKTYGGMFVSYKKDIDELPVTVDLLVGALVSRRTGASWSFEYIKKHSVTANIVGVEKSVVCRIPERELLIALKIHSGRRTDLRDLIVLNEGADWIKVATHLKRGDMKLLKAQIVSMSKMLDDRNLVDSLKGVFGLDTDVKNQIVEMKNALKKLIGNL